MTIPNNCGSYSPEELESQPVGTSGLAHDCIDKYEWCIRQVPPALRANRRTYSLSRRIGEGADHELQLSCGASGGNGGVKSVSWSDPDIANGYVPGIDDKSDCESVACQIKAAGRCHLGHGEVWREEMEIQPVRPQSLVIRVTVAGVSR